MAERVFDVIVIGGGQSALACGYFLRRSELDFVLLDSQDQCGGAWLKAWDSLTLFSPSQFSSLPGWMMPKSEGEYPTRDEVINYLCLYESRYNIPVYRSTEVISVSKEGDYFRVGTNKGDFTCRALIAASGTWEKPFVPEVPGIEIYQGEQFHSAHYKSPTELKDKKVLVVGEGNSGAQILAEISKVTETVWATKAEPEYLADDVDGRVLFDVASAKYYAEQNGESLDIAQYNLGNIVMVSSVKEARGRGVLHSKGSFQQMTSDGIIWSTGEKETFDVVVWCTGFRYATDYLNDLVKMGSRGKIPTKGTKALETEGLWLVGFGGWTGFASATLIGVGRSARQTIREVEEFCKKMKTYTRP